MNLAFDDVWLVLGLNIGRGHFFKFFRCSNDFISQKVYFLWLMRVYVDLIMLAAYFVIPANQKWNIIAY